MDLSIPWNPWYQPQSTNLGSQSICSLTKWWPADTSLLIMTIFLSQCPTISSPSHLYSPYIHPNSERPLSSKNCSLLFSNPIYCAPHNLHSMINKLPKILHLFNEFSFYYMVVTEIFVYHLRLALLMISNMSYFLLLPECLCMGTPLKLGITM